MLLAAGVRWTVAVCLQLRSGGQTPEQGARTESRGVGSNGAKGKRREDFCLTDI